MINPNRRLIEFLYPKAHGNLVREILRHEDLVQKKLMLQEDAYTGNELKRYFLSLAELAGKYPKITNFLLGEGISGNKKSDILLSNAAGMNKNAEIPSTFLKVLGFDRNVIGTVTGEQNDGNPEPTIWYHPEIKAIRNNEGLPGPGAEVVLENLMKYEQVLPITLNLMAKPGSKDPKGDVRKTLEEVLSLNPSLERYAIDEITLNISCPNTDHTIDEYRKMSSDLLIVIKDYLVETSMEKGIRVGVKVSPDSQSDDETKMELDAIMPYIDFIEAVNTTRSKQEEYGVGGMSDQGLDDRLINKLDALHRAFNKMGEDRELVAVGGLDSRDKIDELKNSYGINRFQVYSPFVRLGPSLIRELKTPIRN